jgi:hypothetical protein
LFCTNAAKALLTAFPLKAIARLVMFEVLQRGSVLIFPTHEKTDKTAFASVFATLKRFARAFAAQTCICSLRSMRWNFSRRFLFWAPTSANLPHVVFLFAAVAVSTNGKRSPPFAHETARNFQAVTNPARATVGARSFARRTARAR